METTGRPILPSNSTPCSNPVGVVHVRQQSLQVLLAWSYTRPLPEPVPSHLGGLPIEDLELLYGTLRNGLAIRSDIDDDIQLGFSFPYVLHIILSLSALRLFDKQPARTELLDRACRHQDQALMLVRPHLVGLDRVNVQAVLRFSFLVSIAALGQPLYQHRYRAGGPQQDPIDDILHSFNMTRGIKFVTERQWQLAGESRAFEGPDKADEDPWKQDLGTKYPVYPLVRQLVCKHCATEQEKLVCLDAIRKVFSFTDLIEQNPQLHPDARLIQIWPIEIDGFFMAMMSARRPIALLILAFYCALLKLRSGNMWPYSAWPGSVLQRVVEILGKEWEVPLQWPRSRVFGEEGVSSRQQ